MVDERLNDAIRGGVTMRREIVIVGMKTTEEADKAVLEIDCAVRTGGLKVLPRR
jgi:hypothetical protein